MTNSNEVKAFKY